MDAYVKTKHRWEEARKKEGWTVTTEVVEIGVTRDALDKRDVLYGCVKATIWKGDDIISTGIALEQQDYGSDYNKFSWMENAETSAVGRALAFAGYGDNKKDIASNEEKKENKKKNDDYEKKAKMEKAKQALEEAMNRVGIDKKEAPKKVYYTEKEIPIFPVATGQTGRLKDERSTITNWLKKENLIQREQDLITALIESKVSEKYKSINELIKCADQGELVQVFTRLQKK